MVLAVLEFLEFRNFRNFWNFQKSKTMALAVLEFLKFSDTMVLPWFSPFWNFLEFWNLVLLFILIHTLSLNVKQIAVMIASLQVAWLQVAATEKHF